MPSLHEIDQLIPEGIGEPEEEKKTLSDLTGELSQQVGTTYSEGEADLQSISEELQGINLSTAFFEEEKRRQREKKDLEKAQEIRERIVIGEEVSTRDRNWLERYEAQVAGVATAESASAAPVEAVASSEIETVIEVASPEVSVPPEEPASV